MARRKLEEGFAPRSFWKKALWNLWDLLVTNGLAAIPGTALHYSEVALPTWGKGLLGMGAAVLSTLKRNFLGRLWNKPRELAVLGIKLALHRQLPLVKIEDKDAENLVPAWHEGETGKYHSIKDQTGATLSWQKIQSILEAKGIRLTNKEAQEMLAKKAPSVWEGLKFIFREGNFVGIAAAVGTSTGAAYLISVFTVAGPTAVVFDLFVPNAVGYFTSKFAEWLTNKAYGSQCVAAKPKTGDRAPLLEGGEQLDGGGTFADIEAPHPYLVSIETICHQLISALRRARGYFKNMITGEESDESFAGMIKIPPQPGDAFNIFFPKDVSISLGKGIDDFAKQCELAPLALSGSITPIKTLLELYRNAQKLVKTYHQTGAGEADAHAATILALIQRIQTLEEQAQLAFRTAALPSQLGAPDGAVVAMAFRSGRPW